MRKPKNTLPEHREIVHYLAYMKPLSDYVAYVIHDCMQDIPGVSARFMFGGWGLYKDGFMFGLVANDQLYFN